MVIGILWADWDRAAGASPNDIIFTKIAWKFNIEERRHIGFHHFQLSQTHKSFWITTSKRFPVYSDYIIISCSTLFKLFDLPVAIESSDGIQLWIGSRVNR